MKNLNLNIFYIQTPKILSENISQIFKSCFKIAKVFLPKNVTEIYKNIPQAGEELDLQQNIRRRVVLKTHFMVIHLLFFRSFIRYTRISLYLNFADPSLRKHFRNLKIMILPRLSLCFYCNTGALKKIINRANENKKQSQAEKNIKIVKEIVKNLRAVKGEKAEKTPPSVLTSKQTTGGEEFGRLGDAIARGHKPPCICPDKSKYITPLYIGNRFIRKYINRPFKTKENFETSILRPIKISLSEIIGMKSNRSLYKV